ncbi:tyrosine-type recombinase/integrase [Methyloradius palustris]|uniref:Integrase n=1 Tax=Methyloradius palustris TaxID=2778876 RepID=A0A8D5G9D0_9PROT|nr:site-specific integrase [Methyloradius palustris]BCM25491.1 integrase [Methyloradius palustris]
MSLYKRKDSANWWVKVSVLGCKPIQQSTGTTDKQKASEYEAKLKNNLWEQKRLGTKPRYTWEEAVVRYIEETSHKSSHSSDIHHFRWLSTYLANKYLDEIDRSLLDSITAIRQKTGVTNATVNRCMQVVSRVLRRAALDWEWLARASKVRSLPEPQKRIRWLTVDEATKLLNELPPHLEAMVRFSLATGLRQSNVYNLQWSQIDLARHQAWIYADQAKGGKAIAVPLSSEAIQVLRGQLFNQKSHVFTYRGQPITNVKGRAWRKALVRAGIDNFRWHDLRHTWASWHVQNGTPLHVLQQLGGWQSLEMVQKYAHLSSEHLAPYVERVSGLNVNDGVTDVATFQLRKG